MKKILVGAALSVALVAVPAGLASAADREQRQMMADLRMLQEQQQQIQNAISSLVESLKAAEASLTSRFDEKFTQQADQTRKGLADQKLVVDAIAHDLGVVREKLDDTNVRAGTISQEVDALRELVQQSGFPRPAAPSDASAGATDAAAPEAAPPAAPPSASGGATALGSSPAKLWESAYADYGAAQYDLAVLGFQAYIKTFPKSDMADDAQVGICNSFINQGQYEKAVEACDTAIRTYPTGNAVPEGLYKKGLALQNLKRLDDARDAYQLAVQKYPESAAATLASQKLIELKKP